MNELSTQIRRSTCPSPQTREAADAIARKRNRLTFLGAGKYSIPDTIAPSDRERGAMTYRREEIAGGLIAASDSEIDFMLSSLFMAFTTGAAPQISVYRAALRGMPAWAIRLACSAWITGKGGGNLAFAPNAPQLRAEAEGRVIPLRIEAADIGKILGAEVVREPSPEERERVLAKFAKLSADMASSNSMLAAAEPPRRHRYFEGRDAPRPPLDHSTPVKLSADCRAVTGLAPLPIEDAPMHEERA